MLGCDNATDDGGRTHGKTTTIRPDQGSDSASFAEGIDEANPKSESIRLAVQRIVEQTL